MMPGKTYIYGKHAIEEALRHNPKAIERVFLSSEFDDPPLKAIVRKNGIPIDALNTKKLPQGIPEDAAHQGLAASLSLSELLIPFSDFLPNLEVHLNTALVILGELQDPQNVGAVIRSAAGFGMSGILIPEHNQAPITGAVVKVSAGMAFKVPLISIGNVNNAVRDLKERGFWIYGLEGEAEHDISKEKFDAPAVFILGNESKGIREKTRDLCDILLSIPLNPKCESLNAAASAAVALYAWSVQHPEALKLKKSE